MLCHHQRSTFQPPKVIKVPRPQPYKQCKLGYFRYGRFTWGYALEECFALSTYSSWRFPPNFSRSYFPFLVPIQRTSCQSQNSTPNLIQLPMPLGYTPTWIFKTADTSPLLPSFYPADIFRGFLIISKYFISKSFLHVRRTQPISAITGENFRKAGILYEAAEMVAGIELFMHMLYGVSGS